jgi:tripartite-type tricarboxylate transporter receptor subunit TctC
MTKTPFCTLVAAMMLICSQAALAVWPEDRSIEVVVGYAPGGSTDLMARAILPYVRKHLGDKTLPPVVINRPGASGEIATAQIERAKPDGYMIGLVNMPGYLFVPVYRKAQYSLSGIALLARVVVDTTIMISKKDRGFQDLKQVVAALKDKPSSLSVGHNGLGTNGHLALLQLEKMTGVKFNAIPFNGTGQQKTALSGGHIDFALISASEVPDPEKEAVPFRILAQFAKTRLALPPYNSVPTTYEQGFNVEMSSVRGFAATASLPSDILLRLQKAVEAAMKDPEYLKAARTDAPFLSFLPGGEWAREIEDMRASYEEMARSLPKE